MPRYHTHKPLNRRGVTLIELIAGIAVAAVLALVSAGLFKAGLESYNYANLQTRALLASVRALTGGLRGGMMPEAQSAQSVYSLSASTLSLKAADGGNIVFSLSGAALYRTKAADSARQAEAITSLSLNYYSLDGAGHIMVSTSADTAVFVTAKLALAGVGAKGKTYNFMSGAGLRNKQ